MVDNLRNRRTRIISFYIAGGHLVCGGKYCVGLVFNGLCQVQSKKSCLAGLLEEGRE